MIPSLTPSVWWGHLPSSQLPGYSLYLSPAQLESGTWEIHGPSCSISWVAGSTRISSDSVSHLGQSIFPFFLFFPLPSPALSRQLNTVRKVPHNQSIRCKALLKHQLGRCPTVSAEANLQSHPWPFQASALESISGSCGLVR